MLDIRFIRDNAKLVEEKAQAKGYKVDIKHLLDLDEQRRTLLGDIEMVRAERNKLADAAKGKKPSAEDIKHGQHLKEHLAECEGRLKKLEADYSGLLKAVPNIFSEDTPLGGEDKNKEIKTWGDAKKGKAKDHMMWGTERGLIDFEAGAKVAGNKFYFLKAGLVELELAILSFALAEVKKRGFWLMGVPHMVNSRILEGAGFSARGDEKQIYKIEDEDLSLIATAEIPLTGFFADEIMPAEWMPAKMAAWSPAYRVEGGAYGKHNRGLFRTHQFNKVELYVLCKPEESEAQHKELLSMEEEICQALEIPYRVVQIAAGDLGAPAYKKYDVEYWSPAEGAYRELMSCSNVTDYQARRLNIRYKNKDGANEFVHTLNATAAAASRMMIAIIENFQDESGKVAIPKVLQPYMGGQTEL